MKNNKGFFLAETIVMIALVTTIMAFVYPNVSKLYENYKNRVMYYDQTEDLYALRALYKIYDSKINEKTMTNTSDNNTKGCKSIDSIEEVLNDTTYANDKNIMHICDVYIASYMANLGHTTNYNFNKYLKRIKKSTNDRTAYRLIGIFGKDTDNDGKCDKDFRYASVKIDNPNPGRTCN